MRECVYVQDMCINVCACTGAHVHMSRCGCAGVSVKMWYACVLARARVCVCVCSRVLLVRMPLVSACVPACVNV